MITIGLFGTCGNSKWRDPFIRVYTDEKINFFNPQVEDWKPEDAAIEAEHLASDQIILFPITSETYAIGSLAETGFSILNAIKLDDRRDFIIFIDPNLDEVLDNEVARKESLRARALVLQHLKKLRLGNLYVVNSLEVMLITSIRLNEIALIKEPLKQFNPHK
jgi:hypothetical protein